MPSKSKIIGNNYERELVKQFEQYGFKAVRAYGSNGNSFGEDEKVDIKVTCSRNSFIQLLDKTYERIPIDFKLLLQAKKRKKLPKDFRVLDVYDGVVLRENHGDSYILMNLDKFIQRFLS